MYSLGVSSHVEGSRQRVSNLYPYFLSELISLNGIFLRSSLGSRLEYLPQKLIISCDGIPGGGGSLILSCVGFQLVGMVLLDVSNLFS